MKQKIHPSQIKALYALSGLMCLLLLVYSLANKPLKSLQLSIYYNINRPFIGAVNSVTKLSDKIQYNQKTIINLEIENKALKSTIADLKYKDRIHDKIKEDNRNLAKQAKFIRQYRYLDIKVTSPIITDYINGESIIVPLGSKSGIKLKDIALSENGLVGYVDVLNKEQSQIAFIYNEQSKVPVIGQKSGVRGIASGNGEALVLSTLKDTGAFIEGEAILTSGITGVYPKNIEVGKAKVLENESTIVEFNQYITTESYIAIISTKK